MIYGLSFPFLLLLLLLAVGSAQADVFTLSTADTEPYTHVEGTGFYDLLLAEAFARVGHQVRIVRQPSDRSLADAVSGSFDGEYARISGLDARYPSLVRVPVALADYRFTAFVGDPSLEIGSWDDLADLHVGFIDGWVILHEHVTRYASLTGVPDAGLLFGLLAAGRVDVVLYEYRRGVRHLARYDLDAIHALPQPLAERPMYLYLHRDNADLAEQLAASLEGMRRDGTFSRIERGALAAPGGTE